MQYILVYEGLTQIDTRSGEDSKHFAARIKQAAPDCHFTADRGTPKYGANIMSKIFILGLEDTYTCKQLIS